ncbi:MAG: class I SAM-dependent methyltransferase [Prolixibacteraceae bacterium]|nr:class I SAM-dependent methyltransferase [Prolixibacteraceae bacterium]
MKFISEINQYIGGEEFSPALKIPFSPTKFEDLNRVEKVVSITRNKRVIHIGCADHLPLIEEKIKKNKWLHKLLIENTEKCIGVDINQEAIKYMSNNLHISNLYCINILTDDIDFEDDEPWDYVILGELIEHVNNPVEFLQAIRKKFNGKARRIIITAPNILNLFSAKYTKKNIEYINTDHRYWFTPYTLAKVAHESGFKNHELTFAEIVKLSMLRMGIRFVKSKLGMNRFYKANCFSTVILTADFD